MSAKPLTAEMTRGLPDGKMDDSTYEQIEVALDRVCAPCKMGTKWLTLAQRIDALGDMVRLRK
jgi:hypothetical protein